jgi:hypothetical protein
MAETLRRFDLVKGDQDWELKSNGQIVASYRSKAEALEHIPGKVKIGTVRIHTEIGGIEEERTYPRAKDPRKSPG